MPVSAGTLRILIDAGLSGDALVNAVASIDSDMAEQKPLRSGAAIRQARYRDKKASQSDVTSDRNNVTPPPSLKKVSPTPPSKNNPTPLPPVSPDGDTRPKGPVSPSCPDFFDEFWGGYPRRLGANPKAPAAKKFTTLVKSGVEPQAIISGARRYATEQQGMGRVGTEYITQAITWLNQQRWEDYAGTDPPNVVKFRTFKEIEAEINARNDEGSATIHGIRADTDVR